MRNKKSFSSRKFIQTLQINHKIQQTLLEVVVSAHTSSFDLNLIRFELQTCEWNKIVWPFARDFLARDNFAHEFA